ncbi:MAG: GNAT family N-acetyltransferase [Anaerolineales bacterium]|nr:GNAT family N-acetyltransferase [Anaerolineales bacterium]
MISATNVAQGSPASIQEATWRDLNALRQLEKACFPRDRWPLFDLIGVLSFPNVVRLKAIDNGRMVGFIAVDVRPTQGLAWVATIGVLPDYRGRGIGTALLQAGEARLQVRQIRLNVRASNKTAINLYQSLGYQRAGVWPAYYQDGEDALVMEKSI